MDTRSDFRTAVQSALNVGDNSSLFPPTTINSALNRAYIKCARLFRWPGLEDAKLTTTQANIEYYDIPTTWSPDSMYRLTVDGDDNIYGDEPDFSPMVFKDYLDWKEDSDNANSTEKKWAVHGNQYFIYPTPTASALVISIWGQKNVTEMDEDTDTTIFSYNMPECNEAVVLETIAMLKKKGENEKSGELFSAEAKGILAVAFNKLKQESAKEEKDQPMLEVSDFFGKATVTETIGRFT